VAAQLLGSKHRCSLLGPAAVADPERRRREVGSHLLAFHSPCSTESDGERNLQAEAKHDGLKQRRRVLRTRDGRAWELRGASQLLRFPLNPEAG
jgi:hypothetical protein